MRCGTSDGWGWSHTFSCFSPPPSTYSLCSCSKEQCLPILIAGGKGSKMEECYIQLTRNQNMSNTTNKWHGREPRAYCTGIISPFCQTIPLLLVIFLHIFHPIQLFVQVKLAALWNSNAFMTLDTEPCFTNICMALGEGSFNVSITFTYASHQPIQHLETGWTML
jgi:hypothetical protein